MPREVFLSHSSADRAFTTSVADVLRRHGVPVWYSDEDILGAQQWHDEIGAALRRCDWLVLVLSTSSVASTWVKRELVFSLQQDRFDGKIVPILYSSCDHAELSWTLASFQMVDFQNDFDEGCADLLRIWGIGYAPQPTT
ncbi:MAG: toll/interleukin-1 receptor domain-containing protein [Rhodospirillaceae bacterium]|nr:toll/interleukin-1 receptor domain-containing protein [Rhodospirillaceae bacterium]